MRLFSTYSSIISESMTKIIGIFLCINLNHFISISINLNDFALFLKCNATVCSPMHTCKFEIHTVPPLSYQLSEPRRSPTDR